MIVLFTDFGWQGPYVGQMKAVLEQHASQQPVIDLMHDAPAFNPRAAAYLFASLVESFPKETVFLAVVDPGVGSSQRRPCVVRAEQRWYVGPDNGLFNVVTEQASDSSAWAIDWQPDSLSASFHGRDLFAPVAAQLACGQLPAMTKISLDQQQQQWPTDLAEIIYLDRFGNAMTGVRGSQLTKDATLLLKNTRVNYSRVFAEAREGVPFWYVNSNGLVEIAIKQASAAQTMGLQIGTAVEIG